MRAAGLTDAVTFLPGRTHHDAVRAMLSARVLLLEKARHPRPKVCAGGLIPHTLAVTTLQGWQAGTEINIEVDQMARYAARLTEMK